LCLNYAFQTGARGLVCVHHCRRAPAPRHVASSFDLRCPKIHRVIVGKPPVFCHTQQPLFAALLEYPGVAGEAAVTFRISRFADRDVPAEFVPPALPILGGVRSSSALHWNGTKEWPDSRDCARVRRLFIGTIRFFLELGRLASVALMYAVHARYGSRPCGGQPFGIMAVVENSSAKRVVAIYCTRVVDSLSSGDRHAMHRLDIIAMRSCACGDWHRASSGFA